MQVSQPMENLAVISISFFLEKDSDAVIWRGPLKMKVIKQFLSDVEWGALDYLIIDSPPGTGGEPLSVGQLIQDIDGALIVTTPQEVAVLDARKCATFARQLNVPVIGIIENMSGFTCPHCGKDTDLFKRGGGEKAAREMTVPFLGRIPIEPSIVEMEDEGRTEGLHSKGSSTAKAFKEIVDRITSNMEAS